MVALINILMLLIKQANLLYMLTSVEIVPETEAASSRLSSREV